jgi:hypothetical protein
MLLEGLRPQRSTALSTSIVGSCGSRLPNVSTAISMIRDPEGEATESALSCPRTRWRARSCRSCRRSCRRVAVLSRRARRGIKVRLFSVAAHCCHCQRTARSSTTRWVRRTIARWAPTRRRCRRPASSGPGIPRNIRTQFLDLHAGWRHHQTPPQRHRRARCGLSPASSPSPRP